MRPSRLFPLSISAIAVLLALSILPAPAALAQFDSGQIAGFVRDSGGLVVPGATVTAINEGNRQERQAVTNDEGYYVFPNLLVGTYTITAQMPGFKRFIKTGILLSAASKISADAVF